MIEVRDLVKNYGSFRAVDHVSFAVEPGEIVGFLGPNGAGKTTTIRVLAGYQPATSGTVTVLGRDVVRHSLEVRAGLGYLPENVPIYPDLRVEEYLRWRASLKGVPRREIKSRVEETMERAGVVEMRRKLVGHVSRGYRQRVGLADALVSLPPVLILDEPTSGLDPNQRRKIREVIRSLGGKHTVLMSSHILSDVEEVCERVVLIHKGRKQADGSLRELSRTLGVRELRLRVRASEADAKRLLDGLAVAEPHIELADAAVGGGAAMALEQDRSAPDETPAAQPTAPDAGSWLRVTAALAAGSAAGDDELLDECWKRLNEASIEARELVVHEPTLEEVFWRLTQDDDDAQEAGAGGVVAHGTQTEESVA